MDRVVEYENLRKLNQPFFEEYKYQFAQTLESGWYVLGKNVEAFENEFAEYCGAKFCVGVASGLDALILSFLCCDFPKGSEVLVPSNTYIATILAVVKAGLVPVLVEPDMETYNIDLQDIEKKITKKTKAILPVHMYGKVCNMQELVVLSKKYGLKIIEDCAQAHGAKEKGVKSGTFGDFGAFSFYPTKNLGALGDGGAIITNNQSAYEKLKALRNYGSHKKYENEYLGLNSRLDEVQATFLRVKLKSLNDIIAHKQKLAGLYFDNLPKEVIKPQLSENFEDVFHIYNIRSNKRDELKQYLLESGIKTEIHYPIPPHHQTGYKNLFSNADYPISEEIHRTTLSLPISYFHKESDVLHVCEKINSFFKD